MYRQLRLSYFDYLLVVMGVLVQVWHDAVGAYSKDSYMKRELEERLNIQLAPKRLKTSE